MPPLSRTLLLAASLALSAFHAGGAWAGSTDAEGLERQVMTSDSFLSAHPDLRHRLLGLKAYEAGKDATAIAHFRRASRYADKPSQAMVAEMTWAGRGVPANRPLALAWMELAAERRYAIMLAQRDRFSAALDEAGRAEAARLGRALAAEYGDAVAQPRLERQLRLARRNVTGSRTGFTGNVTVILPGPAGSRILDGSQFFADKFWEPSAYWAWQAEEWKDPPRGRVDVGPLKAAPPAASRD